MTENREDAQDRPASETSPKGDSGAPGGTSTPPYALRFDVDYPDRDLNRLSSALRIFWAIPILIVLIGISASGYSWEAAGGAGMIFLAPVLMIVFRQKYPKWWWGLQRPATQVPGPYQHVSVVDHRRLPFDG